MFWICFALFVAAVVGVIIWGIQSGVFDGVTDNANPNGTTMGGKRSVEVTVQGSSGPIVQLSDLRDGVMGSKR